MMNIYNPDFWIQTQGLNTQWATFQLYTAVQEQ